jgi:hypothetical protein
VYTKPKGKLPDFNEPVVLHRGKCTVEDFCDKWVPVSKGACFEGVPVSKGCLFRLLDKVAGRAIHHKPR